MPPQPQRTSARLVAPLALAVAAVAVLVVIAGSLGGDGSDGDAAAPTAQDESAATQTATTPNRREPATYTVEPGDTLGAISEETGVPIETLEILNPELDPQALIAGQKIKLRE
jgi:LysM repeat protein